MSNQEATWWRKKSTGLEIKRLGSGLRSATNKVFDLGQLFVL